MANLIMLLAASVAVATSDQVGYRMKAGKDGWVAVPRAARSALRNVLAKHTNMSPRSAQADGTTEAWTTDHHNVYNSGRTVATGPADTSGSCRASFFNNDVCMEKDPANCPVVPHFFSTGVGSAQNTDGKDYFFFGGDDNQLRVVSGSARLASAIKTWTCNMTNLRPASAIPPVSDYGIVASAAAWDVPGIGDRLAVPSGDGWVYILNIGSCLTDATACTAGANGQVGQSQAQAPQVGAGSCMQAAVNLPGTRAVLSPARFLSPAESSTKNGLVLVSASDPLMDMNGALYAIDAGVAGTSFVTLWSFDPAVALGTSTGLRGIIPALNPTTGMLFLPVGTGLAVLNVTTGKLITSIVDVGKFDAFVSSPVLTGAMDALFLHGASGAVYRFNLAYAPDRSNVTITPAWSCDYTLADWNAKSNPCSAAVGGVLPVPEGKPWVVHDPITGKRTGEVLSLPRNAIVSGGAPRASTAAQVATLRAGIVAEFEAAPGAGKASEVMGESEDARLSFMLTRLSSPALSRLRLSSSTSNPYPYLVEFPYATPALLKGAGPLETALVVTQFKSRGTGLDTGMFTADLTTGQPLYAFFALEFSIGPVNISLPMGRSRSSPTVDAAGAVYFGADIDWPFASDDDESGGTTVDSMPTLFAFKPLSGTAGDPVLDFAWSWNMGEEADVLIGSASPVVRVGIYNEREVLMVAFDGAVSVTEGSECKSADPVLECSGSGVCDCATGGCVCDECYSGADCGSYDENCGKESIKAITPEVIAGAVGLPLALIGVGAAAYLWHKRKAGAQWAAMLPAGVAKRLGVAEYTPVATGQVEGGSYGAMSSTGAAPVQDWKATR